MRLLVFMLLFLSSSLYGVDNKETKEDDKTLSPDPELFKKMRFIYIKKGTYAEVTSNLKLLMPMLEVNKFLFLESYSDPHVFRAFNDYIGHHFILGRVKEVHKGTLIWQRTDVLTR